MTEELKTLIKENTLPEVGQRIINYINIIEEDNEDLQNNVEGLEDEISELEKEISDLEDANHSLTVECLQLQNELNDLKTE